MTAIAITFAVHDSILSLRVDYLRVIHKIYVEGHEKEEKNFDI